MRNPLAALLLLLGAASALAAVDSESFSHPKGDYALQYPVGWKRGYGVQSLILRPGTKAPAVRFHIERHGAAGDKSSPADYEKQLRSRMPSARKLLGESVASVGGKPARRLEFVETKPLKGPYKAPLAGPMREVYLVVPLEKAYYVLYWEGYGEDADRYFRDCEQIASSVRWSVPAKP